MSDDWQERPKTKFIELSAWEEYPRVCREIMSEAKILTGGNRAKELLFRGLARETYELASTLERSRFSTNGVLWVHHYLRFIEEIQAQVSSLTGQTWDQVREANSATFYDKEEWYRHYPYMTYLRHHGYPSPLLDWTISPYVAAYFAFQAEPSVRRVAVYAFLEYTRGSKAWKADEAHVKGLGPIVQTHHRHYRQQSRYTVCVKKENDSEWHYVPYGSILESSDTSQDLFWKITLPMACRDEALAYLRLHNVTGYSLFGTEEALLNSLYCEQVVRNSQ